MTSKVGTFFPFNSRYLIHDHVCLHLIDDLNLIFILTWFDWWFCRVNRVILQFNGKIFPTFTQPSHQRNKESRCDCSSSHIFIVGTFITKAIFEKAFSCARAAQLILIILSLYNFCISTSK